MKKNILLLVLLFVSLSIMAQNNVEDNEVLEIEDSTKISKELNNEPMLSNPVLYNPSIFSISSLNYPSNPYSSALNSPLIWNLNLNDTTSQSRFLFNPFKEVITYLGLVSYENYGAEWMWRPTNKFSFEGRAFISKQYGFLLSSMQIAYIANFSLNYKLTDILQLSVYGQYVTPANKDPFLNASGIYQTKVGAALIVEPKENLKIGADIESQYNNKEKVWRPKTGAKVSIGF